MTLTILEASKLYLDALEVQGKSPKTLYTYGKDLEQVRAYFGPDKDVHSINTAQVGKFLKSDALLRLPEGTDRAQETVSKTIRVFRMFLFWLKENGHIEAVPMPKGIPLGRNKLQ